MTDLLKHWVTKLQPKLWFGSTVGSQTLGPPTDESLQAKVNPARSPSPVTANRRRLGRLGTP